MAQINLLPWREQARKEVKIQFLTILGIGLTATLVLALLIHLMIGRMLTKQQSRNDFLMQQTNQSIAETGNLEENKKKALAIIADLKFLTGVQIENFQTISILNEIAKITPSSIVLNKLVKQPDIVFIEGNAQSNIDVTQYIQEMSKSSVLNNPVLTKIQASDKPSDIRKSFQIKVEEKDLNAKEH